VTCIHLKLRQCTCAKAPTFNRAVPPMVCAQCKHYEGPVRGAGDVVHAVTTATGIARVVGPCGGCAERRVALNKQSETWREWLKRLVI
jgi:hypothetical protein